MPHPALALPDEVVTRPDTAVYRRRFVFTGAALGLVALVCLVVAVVSEDPGYRIGAAIGGLLVVVLGGLSLQWQRRTYLREEPALVLQRQQFRVLHKGQHVWVPWADVQDLSVLTRGAALGRSEILCFDLRPEAAGRLPQGKASVTDRMFSWATNDLAYARPADTPPFQEVVAAAMQLHDHATGGHRFRAAQEAAREGAGDPPPDRRGPPAGPLGIPWSHDCHRPGPRAGAQDHARRQHLPRPGTAARAGEQAGAVCRG